MILPISRFDTTEEDEYFFVDIFGKGTVMIKDEENGIVVDIFPLHVVDEPVASTWADMSVLVAPEEEE